VARVRMTSADAQAAILETLPADGSPMSHNDLVDALVTAGKADAVPHLFSLAEQKVIVGKVVGQPEGRPVLQYTRGGDQ
jgi:hypothetical protein